MFLKLHCIVLVSIYFLRAVYASTVVLSPPVIDVIENSSVTLTCSGNGTESRWVSSSSSIVSADIYLAPNGSCLSAGFIVDSKLYEWSCYKNNTFSLTLKNVSRSENGEGWTCLINYLISNNVTIYVKVPVQSAKITSHLGEREAIMENSNTTLTCHTGPSRPIPTISWFLSDPDTSSIVNITVASSQSPKAGDSLNFIGVESDLKYVFNRSQNGWHVYCQASNLPNRSVTSSSKLLSIMYPPDGGPTLTGIQSGGVLSIVEYQKGNVSCTVSGGNPHANLTWHCFNGNVTEPHNNENITSNITWTVLRKQQNKSCTCESEHIFGDLNASVTVNVLFSPEKPTFKLHAKNVTEMVKVIQNNSLNVVCTSESNPESDYKWTKGSNFVGKGQQLTINRTQKNDSGEFECSVNNTMIGSNGLVMDGRNRSTITLHILYPAEVGDLTDITVLEGSSINVTCPVIHGNPPEATVQWTPGGDVGSSDSSRLYISNISRNDENIYICSVTTLMSSTYGLQKTEINYGQFQLTVNYKARVTNFFIGAEINKDVYTVNETEDVVFTCSIDSKPMPNATILLNDEIAYNFDNSNFTYRRENIQCADFGLYQCTGINKYNYGSESVMNLTLYINCFPRPSPIIELKTNVSSARNTMATFSFTALAYPEPGPAGFVWSFINGSDRMSLSNRSNVFILNTKIQSNLVIRNVSHESYGQYILRINNTLGVFEQTFFLKPLDVPMAPAISNTTSGEAHITISVKAGFNGGLPQWFYLKYKKIHEEGWISETMVNATSNVFNYTIHGLSSGQFYQLMLFAGNIKGNSTHVFITAKTKEHNENTVGRDNSSSITAAVAGSTSGVTAVIVVIVIAGLLYKKRRNGNDTGKLLYQNMPFTGNIKNKKNKCEKSKVEETPFEGLQEVDDVPMITKEPVEYYNSQDILETIDRIKVTELFSYLTGKDEDSFGIDYQKLPTGLEKPCTFARKSENLAKNRYNGIYPYDHSRVKLHGDPDFFINACYIDGYKRTKAYIASLGPTAKTTSDFKTFWQMIWHEQSDIIVMLTNLREPSGMKCEKYWPDHGNSECYGDITVTGQNIEMFAEYTVRIFSVQKDDESRTVTHLHYTAWPDKKVPEDTMSLLEFRQRIKLTPTGSKGPVVVHCSAGIGRTGTLIALDKLIEEGQCEGSVNVYECVLSMREQRVKMVQTLEQYIYIYKALVSALVFDSEIIPLESYEEYMDTTSNTTYSYQFKQLQQSVDTESKEEKESRTVNAARTTQNRTGADIPAAHGRVFLYLNREADDSDYINAVYMNSFKRKEYFIVTQSPLTNTVVDFICMLYQEDCTCIVSMEDMKEPGTSVGVYLPSDGQKLKFGRFIVSCTRLEMSHHCIVRKVIIKLNDKNENGEKTLYHFQYTNWMSANDCPMNASEFVQFVTEVEEYANQFCEERSHVLVHCLKANERSGLFCAVTTLIEKLKYERQVNVLNTLRHIRTRRKTSITSMAQLKFCYQAGSVYIKMFRP